MPRSSTPPFALANTKIAAKSSRKKSLSAGLEGEDHLATAKREFEEELGAPPSAAEYRELGEIRQKGGKTVVAFAFEGDLDPATITSNIFKVGGRTYPEVDRAEWFSIDVARTKINQAQAEFLLRLENLLR